MQKKVLCFGELLLRISPAPNDDQSIEKNPFMLYLGGAEANVATALAGWGVPVKYCTALPDNFMSSHIMDCLEYKGIFTSSILLTGNRIGIYYLERGADLKGNMVYDRDHSSFSELKTGMIDWDRVLRDVSWLDFSAISPALNQNVADVCLEAVEAAAQKNITLSIDLNYRARLWKYGKHPIDIIPKLTEYCDLVMGNIWSAGTLLGIEVDPNAANYTNKIDYLDHAEKTSKAIIKRFPKCKSVANTFRFDKPGAPLLYYTTLFTNGALYTSPEYTSNLVVDRSGSGDCFMGGLIYGFYNGLNPQEITDYATAAAFGKLQEFGDSTGQDVLEVKKVMPEV